MAITCTYGRKNLPPRQRTVLFKIDSDFKLFKLKLKKDVVLIEKELGSLSLIRHGIEQKVNGDGWYGKQDRGSQLDEFVLRAEDIYVVSEIDPTIATSSAPAIGSDSDEPTTKRCRAPTCECSDFQGPQVETAECIRPACGHPLEQH